VKTSVQRVWEVLENVPDPELPTLSILDLGIVRAVAVDGAHATVTITPTYSGCPAMDTIAQDISHALANEGFSPSIATQLAPAWTTDWMREGAAQKLRALGIAAPAHVQGNGNVIAMRRPPNPAIACPQCDSTHVEQLTHFSSTACKALYRCLDCREPFDYFKPI
jgi:ring-1,2-phenylacetyl-CoA epoxidase subunit PaaD